MEGIRSPSQDDTPSEKEADIIGKRSRSPRLKCLRRKLGFKRGSCMFSILWLSLVQTINSQMNQTRNMGIGSIML